MTKIVIDSSSPNFVLSEQAVLMLHELGSELVTASDATHFHDCNVQDLVALQETVREYGNAAVKDGVLLMFGDGFYPPIRPEQRADALLVQVVETLADAACGWDCSSLEVIEIPDGTSWEISSRMGGSEYVSEKMIPRIWSKAYRMPEIYHGPNASYVLESDMPAWERPYVRAMGFGAACPVPDGVKAGDYAYYAHDYMNWYAWRMQHGDNWREKAREAWWYELYERHVAEAGENPA